MAKLNLIPYISFGFLSPFSAESGVTPEYNWAWPQNKTPQIPNRNANCGPNTKGKKYNLYILDVYLNEF